MGSATMVVVTGEQLLMGPPTVLPEEDARGAGVVDTIPPDAA